MDLLCPASDKGTGKGQVGAHVCVVFEAQGVEVEVLYMCRVYMCV